MARRKRIKRKEKQDNAAATPDGGMTGQQIADKGWSIDLPFESPDPGPGLQYGADGEAEKWTPPEGLQMGGVAWDELPPIEDPAEGEGQDGEPDTPGYTFYDDEAALVREGEPGSAEVWHDGTGWVPYPDFNWATSHSITPEEAAQMAGGEENLNKPGEQAAGGTADAGQRQGPTGSGNTD